MPNGNPESGTGTCFVIMGFGKKTDFETGRVLDLDMSYHNMIKPAVEAAGLKCIRADEIPHSGVIDVPMYEQLLDADVVVADLSTSNKNAFYELGIRHALKPFTTIVIAEDQLKSPFDVNHILIRQYHHLGEDIGSSEARRFIDLLENAIKDIMASNTRKPDSPVYTFLPGLNAPVLAAIASAAAQTAAAAPAEANVDAQTRSSLMQKVDEAQKKEDWAAAKIWLTAAREMMKPKDGRKEDPYIIQRLALITYKSKSPNEVDALKDACELLWLLDPKTSNDTETLGLWGATHKRLWDLTKETKYLDEAIRAYERGFYLRNDYYNGINYAFLLNVRANVSEKPEEAIADFVQAKRVRKEVLSICEKWIEDDKANESNKDDKDCLNGRYWVKATMGEAYVGLDEKEKADTILNEAYANAPEPWMKGSTEEQLGKLKPLLDNSPLKFIKEQ
jgi:hypothetical protein